MGRDKVAKGRKKHEKEEIAKRKSVEEGNRKKQKKKGKRTRRVVMLRERRVLQMEKRLFKLLISLKILNLKENLRDVGEEHQEEELVRGKRFSPEEDEMVKESVLHYIKSQGLGEEGLDMVLHCKSHPEVRNCWKKIGAALPWRPYQAIYYRAHMLFERDDKRKWTPEEYELVRRFHEKHGSDWRMLADALGKHRFHVKDTWRRIKLPNRNKGQWSQEEYQNLFDLVNMDLRMKAFQEKKSKHGMLRDNICWEAISEKLSTRITSSCCLKWYNQLSSPMVAEGEWEDADDYRLLIALFSLDACCMEDVDWDYLLEHRSGDLCRKRWNQMVRTHR
ncbi:hypothetical protein L1049_014070 [Liquidambar formosana]|uniref:Cyclin-D-binding Myb-like transcription factor 1 n=1 Tax=Liquidambar formosana TaxID=63359 RepID=A0AAP0RR85_LIQFO